MSNEVSNTHISILNDDSKWLIRYYVNTEFCPNMHGSSLRRGFIDKKFKHYVLNGSTKEKIVHSIPNENFFNSYEEAQEAGVLYFNMFYSEYIDLVPEQA